MDAKASRYSNGAVLLRFHRNDRSRSVVVVKSERVHGVPLFIEKIYEEETIGKQYGVRLAKGSPREDCRRRRRNRRRKPRHTPVGLFIVTRTYGDRFRN